MIIGPESTGKSTLAKALAKELETVWVPEYARDYLIQINRPYQEQDLLQIAKGQIALEDTLALQAHRWLICDTDLYVIKVWSEHKYHRCDPWILQQIAKRNYDLYLLTDIDLPWEDDPLRENPEPNMRTYFFNVYHDIVVHSHTRWQKISGTPEERIATALRAIQEGS